MKDFCCSCNRCDSIGVIDSGIGGITVLSALMEKLPGENFIYFADKSGAPYGDKSAGYILSRTVTNCVSLIRRGVKAIVVACNTATNVGISRLRKNGSFLENCIYIGLEPAVKPAMETIGNGNVLVLLTPATSKQDKFRELIARFDAERIIVSPQSRLAALVEENIDSLDRIKGYVFDILSKYDNIDAVVLGCTHYIYLRKMIHEFYCGKAKIFDGNEGAANRLSNLLNERELINDGNGGCVELVVV